MSNVKTISQNEAVDNTVMGYMKRVEKSASLYLIGDKVESWSTNTLESGYTKTN